jgi:hypothetical protein
MDKLVSVVIPTFSRQDPTDRAVDSVVTAHPELVEIVVVDDCGTLPYVRLRNVNRAGVAVRVLRSEVNQGPGLSRRLGVEHASGSVIAFLDSDDVFNPAWTNSLLELILQHSGSKREGMFVGASADGGTPFQLFCIRQLARLPASCTRTAVRLCAVFFNPFYTPATAISRSLCRFSATQRYCEDYFTNAMAIFSARTIVVPGTVACTISRCPGDEGGLSAARRRMRRGEWQVRWTLLRAEGIPLQYKLLLPFGMLYSALREAGRPMIDGANRLRTRLAGGNRKGAAGE